MNTLHLTTREAWRRWLRSHHRSEREVWLVYYKKHTGKPRVAYKDALEEAICFGWIDALVRRIDDERYAQKWMPRKRDSAWSEINRELAQRLISEKRMTNAGLAALGPNPASPKPARAPVAVTEVAADVEAALKRNKKAWTFFQSLAPGYQKRYLSWIASAKREETRKKRIAEAKRELARGVKSLMK